MKFIGIILLLVLQFSYSQWTSLQNGINVNLHCVQVLDSLNAFVAGDSGKVYRTVDGGTTWINVSPSSTSEWFSMSFVDVQHGWVGGRNGSIARTTNGGSSWSVKGIVSQSGSNTIESMEFVNKDTGYVAGGGYFNPSRETYIYKTTDGGVNWVEQLNQVGGILLEMDMVNASTGFVVGTNGGAFKTTNGGTNWDGVFIGTPYWLRAVAFTTEKNGVAMGLTGMAYRTTNGGTSWNSITTNTAGTIESVCFSDALNGWAVGESGFGMYTKDGGATWKTSSLSTSNMLWGVHFKGKNGMAVGDNGTIFKYDGAAVIPSAGQWTSVQNGITVNLHCVQVLDSLNAFVGGDSGKVYRTIDAGTTWIDVSPSSTSEWFSMSFVDVQHGWVGGRNGSIARTTNGGSSWSVKGIVSQSAANNIESMEFVNKDTGYVAGGGYFNPDRETYIYKTTDGGVNWVMQLNQIGGILLEMDMVNASTGYVVGTNGGAFKTTNGGTNWEGVFVSSPFWLRAVAFTTEKNGVAMGLTGMAYRTTNGGTSWSNITTNTTGTIESVCFSDAQNGWAVGESGLGMYTKDGGATWKSSPLSTSNMLWGVHFKGKNGMAVGDNGTIFKYDGSASSNPQNSAIVLAQPNGGEQLKVGTFYSILWSFDDPAPVNIDFTTNSGATWTSIDKNVEGAVYHWLVPNTISSNCKIRIISSADSSIKVISKAVFSIASSLGVGIDDAFPTEFSLGQNFPNPFNPSTVIRYGLPGSSSVTLKVFNMLGQEMATLVDGVQNAGWHSIAWEAKVSTGMYFYQITATDIANPDRRYSEIKKMILMK